MELLPTAAELKVVEAAGVGALAQLAMDRAIADGSVVPVAKQNAAKADVEAALAHGLSAAKKISEHGSKAELTKEEKAALPLFVLVVSRPALFVQDDRPSGSSDLFQWIEEDRLLYPAIARGVGRIQTAAGDISGTGFLVADKRLITNNHVVSVLFGQDTGYWKREPAKYAADSAASANSWEHAPPILELKGELPFSGEAPPPPVQAKIVRVVSHHPEVDFAILELDAMPAGSTVLALSTTEPTTFKDRPVFALGYPTQDTQSTSQVLFERIFGSDPAVLGRKRFSPGKLTGWRDEKTFQHDASTLAGSSGSCIVDFEKRHVLGIHFSGRVGRQNNAVPLWKFRADPILVGAGVKF
ncbi:MAG: trypsin-like serine peptidase [Kofleriaceae bacterium]